MFAKLEANRHIKCLAHENGELRVKLSQENAHIGNLDEKIDQLEACCNQLEAQLTDTIKVGTIL